MLKKLTILLGMVLAGALNAGSITNNSGSTVIVNILKTTKGKKSAPTTSQITIGNNSTKNFSTETVSRLSWWELDNNNRKSSKIFTINKLLPQDYSLLIKSNGDYQQLLQ